MDRFQLLKTIVYILTGLLLFEIGMLIVMIRPTSFQPWAALGVIAVVCIYFSIMSLGLIKELKDKPKK